MRTRVVGLSIGALALAAGCATSTANQRGSSLEVVNESPAPRARTATTAALLDSVYAQSIADREGPRVNIRAEVSQLTSSRRVRAVFDVADDAYVLIGHVDATGVLRVVFPADPSDDGFVQGGGRSYETPEFFGGFNDAYMFRYANYGRLYGTQPQAYDGGGGYLFIVASWRPLHYEKLGGNGQWDSFEMTNEAYVRDPRPAIYELASVLAGESREAYTVKFATYFNSQDVTPGAGYSGYSAFNLGMCNASFYGWGQSIPWSYLSTTAPFLTSGYSGSETFFYRGRQYAYDALQNCAYPLPYAYRGTALASGPVGPTRPGTQPVGRARTLSAFDSPRNPFEPRPVPRRLAPTGAQDGGVTTQGHTATISSEYRRRGLVTEDRPEATPASGRGARIDAGARTRPGLEQMIEHRTQNGNEGSTYNRGRLDPNDSQRSQMDRNQAIERARTRTNEPASRPSSSEPSRYVPRGGDQGTRSAPPPRSEAPRAQPRSEPRSAEPRSEPRSAPPARSAEPRSSEPASRSTPPASTSGSKPPTP